MLLRRWTPLATALALLVLLTGCAASVPAPKVKPAPMQMDGSHNMSGMQMEDPAHMFDLHPTPGQGAVPAQVQTDGNVKVFELTASQFDWEVSPGVHVQAMGFNHMVPGPTLRVTEGDTVRIIVHNQLPEATSVHFHGLNVPFKMDGVAGLSQPPINPGETFTYEFKATPAGTHWYHSHFDSTTQVSMGMYGTFIVDPKTPDPVKYDKDFVIMLNDTGIGLSLNGKAFPATEPLVVKQGDRVRIRYVNAGTMVHPMHLHGHTVQVIAEDGYPLERPLDRDVITIAPGETKDIAFVADNPGVWPLHCHILPHAENEKGMIGMTMVLKYEGF